jgi:cell division protein FtsI (penicillin-binding protein 3)
MAASATTFPNGKSPRASKPSGGFFGGSGMRATKPDEREQQPIVLPRWRSMVVVFTLLAAFAALLGRAMWLQIKDRDSLRSESQARISREIELPAFRGRILDRNGEMLAVSTPARSVFAVADKAELSASQINEVGKLLDIPAAQLSKRLQSEEGIVMLKRGLSPEIGDAIAKLKIPGIGVQNEYKRMYPHNESFAQVLGMANIDDVGQEGIELAQNGWLGGKPGKRRVIVNRRGEVVEDIASVETPLEGRDVQLSIDQRLQFLAYQALADAVIEHKAKAGSAVVLDAQSGEILALTNYPSFNPNKRATYTKERARNRALTDTFEPGSTIKPFTMATALERGLVRPDSIVATAPGTLTIGNRTIRDAHVGGDMTMEEVVAQSSNVGTAKIALRMNNEVLHKSYALSGFGTSPQTGFPGEVGGRLRNPASWREIEKVTMSYGYGLSVNLVQLARAYTVFASDGERKAATLMRTNGAVAGEPVFTPKTVLQIRKMLELAVESEKGTGQRARVVGYRVGGKTGTAKKSMNGRYADGKYVGSFVGIAPMSSPRVVVAVMIDEPDASPHKYYGGVVAAPAFSRITREALRLLNVPFDAAPEPDLPRPVPTPESLPKEEV